MTRWIDSRTGDVALRGAGVAMLVAARFIGTSLTHMVREAPGEATLGQLALCALVFLGISLGLALFVLGRHIGDRITVSDRWAKLYPPQPRSVRDRPVRTQSTA